MEYWPLLKGLLTNVPFLYRPGANARGGSIEARYCYSVWLRHLSAAETHGLQRHPQVVAELGPGLSLGVGLAALLSGAERYVALDVSRDADPDQNEKCVAELAQLFDEGAHIPDDREYPEVVPRLAEYTRPALLSGLGAMAPERVAAIRQAIRQPSGPGGTNPTPVLTYVVPWHGAVGRDGGSVDFMIAQAVMEHVDDIRTAYRDIATWLRPGGFFSAAIDFRSHGLTRAWNGHWGYTVWQWRTVLGRRRWGINRLTLSQHLRAMEDAGLSSVVVEPVRRPSAVTRRQLAPEFASLPNDDLETAGVYVLAMRR